MADPTPADDQKAKSERKSWFRLSARAKNSANISVLFLALILIGGAGGYYYQRTLQTPVSPTPKVTSLSSDDLDKLSQQSENLGSAGQVLSIGADSRFRGKIDVSGDSALAGKLTVNGSASLTTLNAGATTVSNLSTSSDLNIGGVATFQKSLTAADAVAINGALNVTGIAAFGTVNAATINVRTIAITGALTIPHLATQGPLPGFAGGPSLGGGGTVSISGNDTAGTININTGSAPSAGTLLTITFRSSYASSVHVLLSPRTAAAAASPTFATPTAAGFTIGAATAPPAGSVLSYDYFVIQ